MRMHIGGRLKSLPGPQRGGARLTAVIAALLFFLAGSMTGVVVDRFWLRHLTAAPPPLTVDAMVSDLALSDTDERRVREFLNEMHPSVIEALEAGPDSLLATTRSVHQRLLEILPPEARPRFRRWLQQHHHGMMRQMRRDAREN